MCRFFLPGNVRTFKTYGYFLTVNISSSKDTSCNPKYGMSMFPCGKAYANETDNGHVTFQKVEEQRARPERFSQKSPYARQTFVKIGDQYGICFLVWSHCKEFQENENPAVLAIPLLPEHDRVLESHSDTIPIEEREQGAKKNEQDHDVEKTLSH